MNNNEYKLSSPILPALYQVKAAHQRLLEGYTETFAAISRLSFFVALDEVRFFTNSNLPKVLQNFFWGKFSIFRLLVLRPLVKLYAEAHVQKKLRELKVIYMQAKHRTFSNNYESVEYFTWLKEASDDCEQLAATVNSGRLFHDIIRNILILIANFLIAAWGATSFIDLSVKIISSERPSYGHELIAVLLITTVTAIPLMLTFLESGFTTKRDIFRNINLSRKNSQTIYQLENDLFDLVGHKKSQEAPIDLFVAAFFLLITILFIWLLSKAFEITFQVGQGEVRAINYSLCLIAPMVIFLVAKFITDWTRRNSQEEL